MAPLPSLYCRRWAHVTAICMLLYLIVPQVACFSTPTGELGDLSCNVEAVEDANSKQLNTILSDLMNTTFFRLFRVDLEKPCPLTNKVEKSCSAKPEDKGPTTCSVTGASSSMGGWGVDPVDRHLSIREEEALAKQAAKDCDANLPEFWLDMCSDIITNSSEFVNLQLNPEQWTGFNGSKLWAAIYEENCFQSQHDDDMCYELRVLYRLLSGMHCSINTHVFYNYYPPRKGVREKWETNPRGFMDSYGSHPEYIKNLHYSFVVLLRALRKMAPVLQYSPISTGDPDEDRRTQVLIRRLLESDIIQTCNAVFTAFDESLMFKTGREASALATLKTQFKGVFQNISGVLDCVTCQKCKLHGKLQLLGLGTALKILLVPESVLLSTPLTREELVALVNTVGKFSQAIRYVDELFAMAQELYRTNPILEEASPTGMRKDASAAAQPISAKPAVLPSGVWSNKAHTETILVALAAIQKASADGAISNEQEEALVTRALASDAALLALAVQYGNSPLFAKFGTSVLSLPMTPSTGEAVGVTDGVPYDADVVVVGGGLAGLTTALTLLDRGATVVLLEKEGFVGGNSAKASSGINGVSDDPADNLSQGGDKVEHYRNDMVVSGRLNSSTPMMDIMAERAGEGLIFLTKKTGLKLDKVVQMGGHSYARTYRPSNGMAGSEITLAVSGAAERLGGSRFKVMKKTQVTELLTNDKGRVIGVVAKKSGGAPRAILARHTVLATGGFALAGDFLKSVRPDLTGFASTNGRWATGDGHRIAIAAGAETIDLSNIQIHPTAFIDPAAPTAPTKTLCAELLRGVGGILLARNGSRFGDELGTRDYLVGRMKAADPEQLNFIILLHEKAAAIADKHIPLYTQKGLITEFDSLEAVAEWMGGGVTASTLQSTITQYNAAAEEGRDEFGKKHFNNAPFATTGRFFAGRVTPALHYAMGGLKVDEKARVMSTTGEAIEGLYAAGEIVGGIHGQNRLGGNALTECVVFGRVAGSTIPLGSSADSASTPPTKASPSATPPAELKAITKEELQKHNTPTDCWVALHGKVYDLSDFVDDHPAGPEAITKLAGMEGTDEFVAVHTENILSDFHPIGKYVG